MPLPIIIAAIAVAASLPLLVWSVATAAPRRTSSLRDKGASQDLRQVMLRSSATDRALTPTIHSLARRARRLSPAGMIDALDKRLALAGRPAAWPLEKVLAAKFVLGVALFVVGLLYFLAGPSPLRLLAWAALALIGYFGPDLQLAGKGKQRQATLQRALPDLLDQMTICVEAGLGFEAAMARAGRSGRGPLADELVRTLQEMQVGVARGRALRNLADRNDVSDLRYFVTAIAQAESYGIPVADVLRTQAAELRTKRRQRAEEHAMKIPVKIVFPLVFCILPSLFIVILGPAAIRFSGTLIGG